MSRSIGQERMDAEICVVNFAGGGGADDGIERHTTIPVAAAINHDPWAILMHKTNHPYTVHLQEDVFLVDPAAVCRGRPVGLAWFSPDCTHFSRAKGGTPVKKEIRGLSWVIVRWAMTVRPRVMMMENVKEIRTWGPLMERDGGLYPDPDRKGETFQGFVQMMTTGIAPGHPALLECCDFLGLDPDGAEAGKLVKGLGYDMDWKELCAADYGVPTIRERFFGVFRCDGAPIRWPKATHAKRGSREVTQGRKLPWVGAHTVIDWSIPAPSIFDSKEDIKARYGLRAVRPLAENTMRRVARGLDKFVLKEKRPFIVEVNHAGDFRGQDISDPLYTVTAKHGRGVVEPVMAPFTCTNTSGSVGSGMGEPVNTVRTGGGGGQMLMTPVLVQYHSEQGEDVRGQSLKEPIMTIDGSNRYGVAVPMMVKYYGNDDHGQACGDPLHTVTSRDREGLVLSHICKFKGQDLGQHPETPLHTVTASWGEFAVVKTTAAQYRAGADLGWWPKVRAMLNEYCGYALAGNEVLLMNIAGEWWYIRDIGLRMLMAREAFLAMGFAPDYIIDRDYTGREYPKSEQMKRCGNAVCPPLAGLLAEVNLPEYARRNPCRTQKEWIDTVAV